MKKLLPLFFVGVLLSALLIWWLSCGTTNKPDAKNSDQLPDLNDTTAPASLIPIPTAEIDTRIDQLCGQSEWDYRRFDWIKSSIHHGLNNGQFQQEQASNLQKKLDGCYITTLKTATQEFIRSGEGRQSLIFPELKRYYNSGNEYRPQVADMHRAMLDYNNLTGKEKNDIDGFLSQRYEQSTRQRLKENLTDSGQLPVLKDSPFVRKLIEEQEARLAKFYIADYRFEEKVLQCTCNHEYADYAWYREECKRRQLPVAVPVSQPDTTKKF